MRDTSLQSEIKKYIMDVKSYLICDWKTRRKFIKDLRNDIADFVDENADVSIDDIRRHFGEPKNIAIGFFENADFKKIKRRMNIGRTVIIGVIIALAMWLGTLLFAVIHPYVVDEQGYIVEYMTDEPIPGETILDSV